jgi:hypothetical protein
MENSPVGHRVAQVEAIDKGQKISNAFFLPTILPKKNEKHLPFLPYKSKMCQIKKTNFIAFNIP